MQYAVSIKHNLPECFLHIPVITRQFPVSRDAAPKGVRLHRCRAPDIKRILYPARFKWADSKHFPRPSVQGCSRVQYKTLHHALG